MGNTFSILSIVLAKSKTNSRGGCRLFEGYNPILHVQTVNAFSYEYYN